MRWLWRLLTFLILFGLLRTAVINPQPQAFIAWPESQDWAQKLQGQIKQLQEITQDFPASIEVEVRRLLKDFRLNGDAQEV